MSRRHVLPWVLSDSCLGEHILELGAGYGAATGFLSERVARVTSLEYDVKSLSQLRMRHPGNTIAAVAGDASRLPFGDQSFSSAFAGLVLHHLKSRELQDRAFQEVFRVLRPGGVFVALEIVESWIHHVGHIGSTYTPLSPDSAFARLAKVELSPVTLDFRPGVFRVIATRPLDLK